MRTLLGWSLLALLLACGGSGSSAPPKDPPTVAPPINAIAVAKFDGTAGQGTAPDTERFDGTGSYSLAQNGTIVSWRWDFGDGGSATDAKTSHTFNAGTFIVTLTVKDSTGTQNRATLTVTVVAPPAPGSTRWVTAAGGLVATDFASKGVLASGAVLRGVDLASGQLTWSSDHSITVTPSYTFHFVGPLFIHPTSGDLFATDLVEGGPQPTAGVCRYSSDDGTQRECFGGGPLDSGTELPISMSGTGELAWGFAGDTGVFTWVRQNDGTTWKAQLAGPAGTAPSFTLSSVAAEPFGDVLVSGTPAAGFTFDGQGVGPGPVLMRIHPDGRLVWWLSLPAQNQLLTSGDGTIVGFFRSAQPFVLASQTYPVGTYLCAIETDGMPRWVLPIAGGDGGISVLPSGQLAVFVNRDACGGLVVSRYDLEAQLLWSRDFSSAGCNAEALSISILQSDVLVSGTLQGSVDFGTGATSGGGFLLDLRG